MAAVTTTDPTTPAATSVSPVSTATAAGVPAGTPGGVEVREAPESDWALWRELRLAALEDSPAAFGATLAQGRQMTEQEWRSWWTEGVGPRYLATVDGVPAGMCSLCFPEDHGHEPLVISMWTVPTVRGRGVGRALLNACVEYCVSHGHPRLLLGVAEDNTPARRLYESFGFTLTGGSEPLHSDPSKLVLWMEKPLADG
jgi:ribosomal protein S18 acetylase RimI-like enzyme